MYNNVQALKKLYHAAKKSDMLINKKIGMESVWLVLAILAACGILVIVIDAIIVAGRI